MSPVSSHRDSWTSTYRIYILYRIEDPSEEALRELALTVSQAREYALLGAYDVSLTYFERAASAVTRAARFVADTDERTRWAIVKQDLADETRLVREIMKELSFFRSPPGAAAAESVV